MKKKKKKPEITLHKNYSATSISTADYNEKIIKMLLKTRKNYFYDAQCPGLVQINWQIRRLYYFGMQNVGVFYGFRKICKKKINEEGYFNFSDRHTKPKN